MYLRTIKDAGELKGKRVLLRLDLNVPIVNGAVADDFRIKRSLGTLDYLRQKGAKVVIISHFGEDGGSLGPVSKYLKVPLCPLSFAELRDRIGSMKGGDAILAENLRKNSGEKQNDEKFSKDLASLADIYVNDAFSASHREHASIVGVPKFIPGYFGFLFEEEVNNLSVAFKPEHPFVFILGGAKFSTKLPLVEKFLNIADEIYIGGALANSFFKESGLEIGRSLADEKNMGFAELAKNKKIILPEDIMTCSSLCRCAKDVKEIGEEDTIMDVGPKFMDKLETAILHAKLILWNGPLGNFEADFGDATRCLAKTIAVSGAKSIIGGGDTLAAIKRTGVMNRFSFVSTGGGAMLQFLAKGTLPGIEAIQEAKN